MKKTIKNTAVTENKNEMPAPEKKTRRRYESGHAKTLEAFTQLLAVAALLDQMLLDPPPELMLAALEHVRVDAVARQLRVGDARADFRTVALERQLLVDRFESLAAQAVAQLAGRGAGLETVEDARGYVRKLRGEPAGKRPELDPNSPKFDPSARNISTSQQSNAAKIQTFFELIDFLEAQSAYASVRQSSLLVSSLRAIAEDAQAKHNVSITSAAALDRDRGERNKLFYLEPNCICDLAAAYKELVKGAYGAQSLEYKRINSIRFRRR